MCLADRVFVSAYIFTRKGRNTLHEADGMSSLVGRVQDAFELSEYFTLITLHNYKYLELCFLFVGFLVWFLLFLNLISFLEE